MQHLPCLTGFMTWNLLARQHYNTTPRRWEISLTQSHSAELVCLCIFCDLFNYLHCDANICGDRLLTEIQTLLYKPLRCTGRYVYTQPVIMTSDTAHGCLVDIFYHIRHVEALVAKLVPCGAFGTHGHKSDFQSSIRDHWLWGRSEKLRQTKGFRIAMM